MDLSLEEICLKKMKGEQGENNVKSNYQIEGNRLCHFLYKRHIYLPKYECIILEIDIQILARLYLNLQFSAKQTWTPLKSLGDVHSL